MTDLLEVLGPDIRKTVFAFVGVFLGLSALSLYKCVRSISRLKRIGTYTVSHDLTDHPALRGYLHPHRERLDLHGDQRFLLRVERSEMLDGVAPFKPWAAASGFTGVALFLTFVLIGYVLVTDVRGALSGFSASSAPDDGQALALASDSLAQAVRGLGAKFFISATGVICSVLYIAVDAGLSRWRAEVLDGVELRLRSVFASPEEYDGHLQGLHLEVLQQIRDNGSALREDVQRLNSIEVSVQNLSADVSHRLSQILTKDIGDRLTQIIAQVLVDVNGIAENMKKELVAELQGASAIVRSSTPQVLAHLDAIRREVSGQAQAPIEALLERFNSAVTGGYQGETAKLGATLREFADVVPQMTQNLELVAKRLVETVSTEHGRGAELQQRVFQNMQNLLAEFQARHTRMAEQVGESQSQAAEAASVTVKTLRDEIMTVAARFAAVSQQQAEMLTARIQSLGTAQESQVSAMSARLHEVIKSFGEAERALSTSATELSGVAARVTEVINGTQSVVNAVNGSSVQLRSGTEAARALVDSASVIVREAKTQAEAESKLTRELQQVWPELLATYIKSFEEKSKHLASSWTDTHNHVASLTQGTVTELRDAVDELREAVNGAARTFRTGSSEPRPRTP